MSDFKLRALYIDFNSYFASVEQQFNPQLRGKPIGVLPVMAETTCCIAASYEAKDFGIHTGTSVREARRRCPEIIFIPSRPSLYVKVHHQLVNTIENCLHVEQVCSIDEMWCQLSGQDQNLEQAYQMAKKIKQTIAHEVGHYLRCSIGIAPNRFLAKTASDMQKPDGLVVIQTQDLPDCLYSLALRDLSGIGHSMEKRLITCGIDSVKKLCQASKTQLRYAWRSIEGVQMYDKLRGQWQSVQETERRSVGHSHVLPPEMRHPQAAHAILHRLIQKAAMRLRSYHRVANRLTLSIKFIDHSKWRREIPIDSSADTRTLLYAFEQTWKYFPVSQKPVPLTVSITLSDLIDVRARTGCLFETENRRDSLNAIVDSLNLRFGKNTLYFGGAHLARNHAPMRIAFTHIPDQKFEE